MSPQAGYTGPACNSTTPVTFTATEVSCASNYVWSFPAGWRWINPSNPNDIKYSPVTINGNNSIRLTPGGGQDDAGTVAVKINLDCGTQLSAPSYELKFQDVKITAPSSVCSYGQPVSVNVPPGTGVTWSVTNNMVIESGQGTPSVMIRAASASLQETGTISAQLGCPNTAVPEKSVWIGRPKFAPDQLKGPSTLAINAFATYSVLVPRGSPSSYEWNAHGLKKISETVSGGKVKLYLQATVTGVRTVDLRAYNGCGSTMTYQYVEVTRNGGGGGGGGGGVCDDAGLAIFPNPAGNDRVLHVVPLPCKPTPCPLCDLMAIPPPTSERITPFNYAVYDLSNNRVLSGTSSDQMLDVRSLATGTYILRVEHEGNAYSEHIVIE